MNIIVNKITTAIAALNTGRFFIGIEKEEKYVEIARKRIAEYTQAHSRCGGAGEG